MSDWVLIPCLVSLRGEFNYVSPDRDKGADGSISDSHHSSSSDHTPDEDSDALRNKDADSINEVHALDIDSSGPWPGSGTTKQRFHALVMRVISGEKVKWKSSTDKCRLNYVIWDGHIYDKDNDFEPVVYNGDDPHTNHAHFSGRYETSCEQDTRPWGVKELHVSLDSNDLNSIKGLLTTDADVKAAMRSNATSGVLGYTGGGLPTWPEQPENRNLLNALTVTTNTVIALQAAVVSLTALVAANGDVDEQAIANIVGPMILAQVVPAVVEAVGESVSLSEEEVEAATGRATERVMRDVLGGLNDQPPV